MTVLLVTGALLLGVALVLLTMIVLGGPSSPSPLPSINSAYQARDLSGLPQAEAFTARDGMTLSFRRYIPADPQPGTVVLVHGSAANGDALYELARGLSQAGYTTYVPDIRGHGASGHRGRIDYVGQLEDDVVDLLGVVSVDQPVLLAGFSAGGGFVLRFAADPRGDVFAGYLLLAPFLSQSSSTYRPAGGGWVSVGVPRILAIALLNAVGLRIVNHMPVTRYALASQATAELTPWYSYALARNFRPHDDYRADIENVQRPIEVLVGELDDQFRADQFAAEFERRGTPVRVTVVPGIGHAELSLSPRAIAEAVRAIKRLMDAPVETEAI